MKIGINYPNKTVGVSAINYRSTSKVFQNKVTGSFTLYREIYYSSVLPLGPMHRSAKVQAPLNAVDFY